MGANDNPTLTRHVRVAPSRPYIPPVIGSTIPPTVNPLLTIRLAGAVGWVALYDGGEMMRRSETFPPPPGEWAFGPGGSPCIVSPPVFTLTADVIGTDLPPSHIFRPDELSAWTLQHAAGRMLDEGFIKIFPSWSGKPQQNPIEQMTAAIAKATAAGQYDAAARMSEALNSMANMAKVAAQATGGVPPDQQANRRQRRTEVRGKRR